VEFMLSSFFAEINSSGYSRASATSPHRDSTGGVYASDGAPNSNLPELVLNSPVANGRKGSPDGKTASRIDRSASKRDPAQVRGRALKQRANHLIFLQIVMSVR
jgi:hypothetical protein